MRPTSGAPSLAARACAWGGTLLFFASLSFFLFSYAVTFAEAPPQGTATAAVAADVLLFTVFAVHHSVFARERARAWVARVVPPALERSLYVWIASALFIVVCALWQPVPGTVWTATGVIRWALVALQAGAVWLILRSAAIIDIFELSGIRQLWPARTRQAVFKTSGPYGWIRHPIYAGWFLLVFCVPLMTMTRLVFAVVSSAYLLIAIPFEERSLRATTGEAYEGYMRRVPWKLIPRVF
jgi:protein-S-isoprenylcysteine O-methyltransferase Ste14